jgi:hypothetical protein
VTTPVTTLTVIRKRHLTLLHSSPNIKKKKDPTSPFTVCSTFHEYFLFYL